VLGSSGLGFLQEYRASNAVAQLRQRLALTVSVLRDGKAQTLPTRALVAGDVVSLSAGNLVPADGIVLAARDFLVSEASLTGESFPVEKQPGALPAATPLSRRTNAVHLGTSVRSGTATVLVVHTGERHCVRRGGAAPALAGAGDRVRPRRAAVRHAAAARDGGDGAVRADRQPVAGPAVDRVDAVRRRAGVGLSPELLPAIVSVTLSAGARRMAKRGVIVRQLEAIENLGSMDVLCTDKTGTLTEGTLVLDAATDPDGVASAEALRLAYLNAALETGIANPLDAALVAAGERAGLDTRDRPRSTRSRTTSSASG